MSDPGGHYTDPLEDALSQGAQRTAQLTSLAGAVAQVALQRRALREARTAASGGPQALRPIEDQERDLHGQARLGWTPAHDSRWLAQADLPATARAWAAAACYADTDPSAAAALRKCEERLRQLHPYAMGRYDRLRAEGMNPPDAMCESAPLFDRASHVRTGDPAAARPALTAENPPTPRSHTSGPPPAPDVPLVPDATGPGERGEQRGRQIAAQIQARARAAGRDELEPAELATVLESVTNLPPGTIERITQNATHDKAARAQQATPMTAAQLAALSFPYTAADAVAAGVPAADPKRAAPSTARTQTRRPGRSV